MKVLISRIEGWKTVGLSTLGLIAIFEVFRAELLNANGFSLLSVKRELGLEPLTVQADLSKNNKLRGKREYNVETRISFAEQGLIFDQKIYEDGKSGAPIASFRSVLVLRDKKNRSIFITQEIKSRFDGNMAGVA